MLNKKPATTKIFLSQYWVAIMILLAVSACRENESVIPDVPDAAYVRIFLDIDDVVPSPYKYMYLNGELDSSKIIPLNFSFTDTDQINLGGNDSYYSFGSIKINGSSNYFPSFFDRVAVAPNINGFNFYKWAKVPAGNLRITFTNKPLTNTGRGEATIPGLVFDGSVEVESGKTYTYFLIRNKENSGYILSGIPEMPEVTTFQEKSAYARLINNTIQSRYDVNLPDELDVYLFVDRQNIGGPTGARYLYGYDTLVNNEFLGTVSGKLNGNAPFFKMPVLPDTAFYKNNTLRTDLELPGFRFRFYKKGDSPKSVSRSLFTITTYYGPKPLYYPVDPTFYAAPENPVLSTGQVFYPYTFDPLGGVHPTYCTIFFGMHSTAQGNRFVAFTRYLWEPANASDYGYRK